MFSVIIEEGNKKIIYYYFSLWITISWQIIVQETPGIKEESFHKC